MKCRQHIAKAPARGTGGPLVDLFACFLQLSRSESGVRPTFTEATFDEKEKCP
jgi:hypothetical protein